MLKGDQAVFPFARHTLGGLFTVDQGPLLHHRQIHTQYFEPYVAGNRGYRQRAAGAANAAKAVTRGPWRTEISRRTGSKGQQLSGNVRLKTRRRETDAIGFL